LRAGPVGETVFDLDVLPFHIPEFAQSLPESLDEVSRRRASTEEPDSRNFWLLSLGGGRRKKDTERENDREPDPPHEHLGGDGWRKSSRRRRIA
jgi:hypothetical protein